MDKVLWLLGQFKSEDLEILEADEHFEANKRYVQQNLKRLDAGKAKLYTVEEADQLLEKQIRKHES